jgi:hypothetical protein
VIFIKFYALDRAEWCRPDTAGTTPVLIPAPLDGIRRDRLHFAAAHARRTRCAPSGGGGSARCHQPCPAAVQWRARDSAGGDVAGVEDPQRSLKSDAPVC